MRHMSQVLTYAHHCFEPSATVDRLAPLQFDGEVARFYDCLILLDNDLISNGDCEEQDMLLRLLQGPLADAMTHVGQLAMLRRLAGSPVRGQNFMEADIVIGRIGPDQSEPRQPFA